MGRRTEHDRATKGMQRFWDDAARRNAAWYVDTSLNYQDPDMKRFFSTGHEIAKYALDRSPVPLPGRTLAVEIGSGLGRVCLALAEHFDRVVGVDISREMTTRAAELVDRPGVEFRQGNGIDLSGIEDGAADLVLSFTVFQHIPTQAVIERYIEDAGRVLRPGGLFVFQWNNEPGSFRWRVRRTVLSALHKLGLRRERRDRHAPQFLGSRVPLVAIDHALAAGGMERRAADGLDTLYAFAWAVRST